MSAALLKKQGHEVVGVLMKTWHPEFLECNEEEERRDAMRVAAHLHIPFLTFDFEKVYKKEVADYMISEYRAGRTPNPDVMCNKEVKFGAFLKKSISMGADYVATGHYAQNIGNKLVKANDPDKDQVYFLWAIDPKQFSKIIFPVGHLKKDEVRKLAKKLNLPVSDKKDSQGICFLGEVDLKKFLKHYIKEKKGKVVNEKGEVIGHHAGAVFHTLSERHGFTITTKSPNDKPYYIVGKDIKKNLLIVSDSVKYSDVSLYLKVYKIKNTNWSSHAPRPDQKYTAQIRYHGEFLPCKVKLTGISKAEIVFTETASSLPTKTLVAAGQSCVIYDKDICLGGGVVV